jgi:hypothetical protein
MRSKHHIIPQSRCKGKKNQPENIVKISERLHERYHHLFGNRTPTEILDFLTNYFWGGNHEFVLRFAAERRRNANLRELPRENHDTSSFRQWA